MKKRFTEAQIIGFLKEAQARVELPTLVRRAIDDLCSHLSVLEARIAEYDEELRHLTQGEDRTQTIPGIEPITASAVVASISSGHEFKNGRQFAAWLGLVRFIRTGSCTP